jgi:hypothetical protein
MPQALANSINIALNPLPQEYVNVSCLDFSPEKITNNMKKYLFND